MENIAEQIKKRRTFAIISHPDAGKTTLTEKFLLYGGAINLAGTVKGRKAAKHAVSDCSDEVLFAVSFDDGARWWSCINAVWAKLSEEKSGMSKAAL